MMIFTVASHRVELADEGDMVVAARQRDGEFETASLEAWASLCGPGLNVIDVGAYTGIYSIVAAKAGARVMAVEPNVYVEHRLMHNLEVNGVNRRVKVRGLALSDKNDNVMLHHNPAVRFTSGASIDQDHVEARQNFSGSMMVRCMRLDDLLKPETPIAAMKIDVEGHEAAVLRGASGTIERHRPSIIAELLDDDAKRDVWKFFAARRYDGEDMDGRNWIFRPE